MSAHRITGCEFNDNPVRAMNAARRAPVVITDHGNPAFVLLSHKTYERLINSAGGISLADRLRDDDPEGDFPFEAPKARGPAIRPIGSAWRRTIDC
ncbi:MAG: type II toxin-antitoxin system prevent-host-death family antitoxin [Gammaproteobacteria bacterium]